ncbi:hypothetical protein Hypma_012733 [Hypsizygus marmoreus]|uniref:Uncharacterized protein n=1 Tax=Hypsizygus marmoreus TaxID=39966 RepID=A0A369JF85_HYPMA|nr:hypothetical protein Hypma_012733 [Hypsizygus marmoreus]
MLTQIKGMGPPNVAGLSLSGIATECPADLVTDSERFYNSVLHLLEDIEEKEEVMKLLAWWNRYVHSIFTLSS